MSMLAAALELAELGFRVFPIWPGAKNPITSSGFLDASTDLVRIRQWWGKHPKANIGIATGHLATGEMFIVIDLDEHDPNESGNDAWAEIIATQGPADTVEALLVIGHDLPDFCLEAQR